MCGNCKGSCAMYLESWLSDIYDVLELRTNHGKGKQRMRDLFYGLLGTRSLHAPHQGQPHWPPGNTPRGPSGSRYGGAVVARRQHTTRTQGPTSGPLGLRGVLPLRDKGATIT